MGFMDTMQSAFEAGAAGAQRAVSSVAVEQLGFVKGFVRMCNDGWGQGWHERNGGNATYRLKPEDVEAARPFFRDADKLDAWTPMGVQADNLRGAYFLTTGTGRYMRNVAGDPDRNIGILEINEAGDAWRIVWGLVDGGKPTSEFPSHFMNQSVRIAAAGEEACRVVYHGHPKNVIAMTFVVPLTSRDFSRALWKAMTECVVVFPQGVGVVPWMVPGGAEIAVETSNLMKAYDAVIWAQHGLFASGPDFDTTFGLFHTIEKAAHIYCTARAMNGGSDEFMNTITDEGLRAVAAEFGAPINLDFLD